MDSADDYDMYDFPDDQSVPDFDDFTDTKIADARYSGSRYAGAPAYNTKETDPSFFREQAPKKELSELSPWQDYYKPSLDAKSDISSSLEALSALESLESELSAVEDLDVNDLLREYGFEEER